MEPITDIMRYLRDRLRSAGARNWKVLAEAINAECPPTSEREAIREPLLRKIAYGDRDNPGVGTVQPILSYFAAVDRGAVVLPTATSKEAA